MSSAAAAAEPTILCPKCGAEVKLTESLAAPMVQALKQLFEADKLKIAEKARLEARRETELKLKSAEEDAANQRRKIAEFEKSELALRQDKQKLEDDKRALELDVQRRVDAERPRIQEQAQKLFAEQQKSKDEQQRLRDAEKDKRIGDLIAQLDDAKRRAEQGSQQLQGEVAELDLESTLRARFPYDTIEPVPKGQFGGDCVQRVVAPSGQPAGAILWESKRTKSWSDGWLAKLRDDQRAAKADFAVLLTQVLPKGVERFDLHDGVWVTTLDCAFPLTVALRQWLLAVATTRQAGVGQKTKMEQLYAYLTGPEFRHRVEAIVDSFRSLKDDLDKERTWLTKQWAKREKEIQRALESSTGMVGDLQGIAGKAMPEIDGLEPKQIEPG